MSKIHRGDTPPDGEPLSTGRVEYLEAARARVRGRRVRNAVIVVVILTAVIAFATGLVGTSVSRAKDFVDTVQISLVQGAGWPQQTGITDVAAVASMSDSFVELGGDTCVVYSLTGKKLNSIQSGYARPALAAGSTRFVLYNRSGNELRVESRTQNLYTKTTENSIYLCAVSDAGHVAVVTGDVNSAARLTVYSPAMAELLSWNLTSEDGVPVRMAFSSESRRLAVAAVSASGGQISANVYVVNLSQGEPVSIGTASSIPQWLGWVSGDSILAVYQDRAVLYAAGGGERAVYDFGGSQLLCASADTNGIALLLANGQMCTAVLLDKSLNVQNTVSVPSASRIVRTGKQFYLLTDRTVECFDLQGNFAWSQSFDTRPQALLAGKQLLVFCGNTIQQVEPPQQDDSAGT